MKKLTFVAALAIGAATLVSCGEKGSSASLKSDVDSLSYAIGLEQSQGVQQYLQQMGIDSTYVNDFLKGLDTGVNAGDDKKKTAYNAGVSAGMQIGQMMKRASLQFFAGDSTQSLSIKNFLAGFKAGAVGKNELMTPEQARQAEQTLSESIRMRYTEKQFGDNKKKSDEFIAKKAKEDGVKPLANGVYYKVIKEGTGAIPSDSANVTINYEGKLIDGTEFDSSYKRGQPSDMNVKQVIPGFTEALTHMPVGSKWEVYIPYDQAYKEREAGLIKPYSALVFTVELLNIKK